MSVVAAQTEPCIDGVSQSEYIRIADGLIDERNRIRVQEVPSAQSERPFRRFEHMDVTAGTDTLQIHQCRVTNI